MDYKNWYIQNLIGQGAYANVYLVKHIEIDMDTGQRITKSYAMKSINKLKVLDKKYMEGTMNERSILLKI
jgi:serine/threonine protein kinase